MQTTAIRKLVTIRTIEHVKPIAGAENIELCIVGNWPVVTKRGEFAVGDRGVYFEPDSVLPMTDSRFSFLEKTKATFVNDAGLSFTGYRLRTIRLRKQLSQGLLLPLSQFTDIELSAEDIATAIGVIKWDPAEFRFSAGGGNANSFPDFLRKTDQERWQNLQPDLDLDYEITVKMDGSSSTVFIKDEVIGYCSRNLQFQDGITNSYIQSWRTYDIETKLRALNRNIAFQGELVGPSVNGNRQKMDHFETHVFDVWDIDAGAYLLPKERQKLVSDLGLTHCKIVYEGRGAGFAPDFTSAMDKADALHHANGCLAEGIVYKPMLGGQTFKLVSNHYLEQIK